MKWKEDASLKGCWLALVSAEARERYGVYKEWKKERSRGKEWWLVFIGKWVFKCLINLSQKKGKRVDIGEGKRLVRLGHRRRLSALLLGVTKWKKKVQACS